jgi:DNA polymerase (family 10)
MVITDHSQSLKVANGLSVERLLRQNEEIKALNSDKISISIPEYISISLYFSFSALISSF